MSATAALPAIETRPRPLPVGYYADNFAVVLETVVERYGDLLSADELAFARDFAALPLAARRLYVRLISRRGPCFRRDRLAYAEIPDLDGAARELRRAGFADRGEDLAAAELMAYLLRPELARWARRLAPGRAPAGARKEELAAALLAALEPAELAPLLRRRLELVRPRRRRHLAVFRLLFFGNLGQDWTEFVLRDLGVVRYEAYELRRELRLFPTRAAVEHTLELRQLRELARGLFVAGALEPALALARGVLERAEDWHPATRRLRDRILNRAGRALERAGELEGALDYYRASASAPARERRARVLARLGRERRALALCREIAADPLDESEVVFARGFAHRLRRKLGEATPRPRRKRPRRRIEVERRDDAHVEALALEALEERGEPGFFAENWLWKSLFGLAFWDLVFAPVAGAFEHPFQYGPLDLHSPAFRAGRGGRVEERLRRLEAETRPGPWLLELYERKAGTANRLVSWHEEARPCLELALERLTGRHLARVCDRLSRDLGRYRRGLPDLFVVTREEPGFRLYEVKGPGDQLRPEQKSWIDYLNDEGLPAYVLDVRWRRS